MNVEVRGRAADDIADTGELVGRHAGFHFILGLVRAAVEIVPIGGKGVELRQLGGRRTRFLRFQQFIAELLHRRREIHAELAGVSLVGGRMIFDLRVEQRLRDCRVVDLAVAVAAEADDVDDDVAAELVAEVHRDAGKADDGFGILGIHVEDRDLVTPGEVGGVARAVLVARIGGETDQVVGDDVNGATDRISRKFGEIQRLGPDALSGKPGIAVDDNGNDLRLAVIAETHLLGAGAADGDRVHSFEVARIRDQVDVEGAAIGRAVFSRCTDVVLHVAAAEHAARVHVFKAREDVGRRGADNLGHDRQTPAMAHGEHGHYGAVVKGGLHGLVERGDERGHAFQREALGTEIAGLQRLLENLRA